MSPHEAQLPECVRQFDAVWKQTDKNRDDIVEVKLEARDTKGEIKSMKKEIALYVSIVVGVLTVALEVAKHYFFK